MKQNPITFEVNDQKVLVHGYPELESREGYMSTEVVATFNGNGWSNYEKYVANIQTGTIRQLCTSDGRMLLEDSEIDYETIRRECEYGIGNAENKTLNYGALGSWDGFKDGYIAYSWTLYPDGKYFADSDGYGMRDNGEVKVYGVMNENLEFVVPFRPIPEVKALLQQLREQYKQNSK